MKKKHRPLRFRYLIIILHYYYRTKLTYFLVYMTYYTHNIVLYTHNNAVVSDIAYVTAVVILLEIISDTHTRHVRQSNLFCQFCNNIIM